MNVTQLHETVKTKKICTLYTFVRIYSWPSNCTHRIAYQWVVQNPLNFVGQFCVLQTYLGILRATVFNNWWCLTLVSICYFSNIKFGKFVIYHVSAWNNTVLRPIFQWQQYQKDQSIFMEISEILPFSINKSALLQK